MVNKSEFIQQFFPDTVKEIQFVQIDLELSCMSIPDILNNINQSFPKNSRERNKIISGEKIVAVLCKAATLYPINGIILLICEDNMVIEDLKSRNYVLISVPVSKISKEEDILTIVSKISIYLAKLYGQEDKNFEKFYIEHLYISQNEEDDE